MEKRRRIIFRADGNANTGLGHIMRLLSIAEMVEDLFSSIFVIQNPSEAIKNTILYSCDSYKIVPDSLSLAEEAEWLSEWVEKETDIVVLDGYKFDTEYQRTLKSKNIKLVCIDDIFNNHFLADAVINHAPGISSDEYSLDEDTKFYGGLDYTVIKPKFLQLARNERVITKFSKLFICFGGADFNNLTTKVLKLLDGNLPDQIEEITVVVGESNIFKEEIEKTLSEFNLGKKQLKINLTSDEMIREMQSSHLAILPSSTILYEALSIKMPIISGFYVDNQISVYHGFKNLGVIYGVDDMNEFEHYPELIHKILSHDINKLLQKQRNVIDGYSKLRIRCLMLALSEKYNLKVAQIEDVELYFNWANDPLVRNNAISTDPILYENHIKWFRNKLRDEKCFMFILYFENKSVGQIRFEIEDEEATIDYSIDVNYRGRGHGKVLLEFGMLRLIEDFSKNVKFKAVVKKINSPSNNIFIKSGFTQVDDLYINGEKYNVFRA